METDNKKEVKPGSVHTILAYSYQLFFLFFLIAILLDSYFLIQIFNFFIYRIIGFFFIIIASLIILWAQKSSKRFKIENLSKESFLNGPYKYTRSPTHWGLFSLMFGFGLFTNTFFVVLFSIISFFVSKIFFIKKQEKILARKYGAPYLAYKKSVKF